jgi:hypothetical protein
MQIVVPHTQHPQNLEPSACPWGLVCSQVEQGLRPVPGEAKGTQGSRRVCPVMLSLLLTHLSIAFELESGGHSSGHLGQDQAGRAGAQLSPQPPSAAQK